MIMIRNTNSIQLETSEMFLRTSKAENIAPVSRVGLKLRLKSVTAVGLHNIGQNCTH